MENDIISLANKTMPAVFRNAELTYNASKNILLTQGYTSQAGNTYFQGIRFSDRIIITQQLGHGYCYLFLNGLKIFCYNGGKMTIIGERFYHCSYYNEEFIKQQSEEIVSDYLRKQAVLSNSSMDNRTLETFASSLVAETMKKQLPYQIN